MTSLSRVPDLLPDATALELGPLPNRKDLAFDLRQLRQKGLLRAHELELPALSALARVIDGSAERPTPRRLERLLKQARDKLGDEEFGTATGYLFGLVQGTIGTRPMDLRERAANVFGLSPETFRKDRERRIIARLADELLILAEEPAIDPFAIADAPPAGLGQGPMPATGLPRENAVFTGRDAETAAVIEILLARPGLDHSAPVCALHGMAGVGKTALALRLAGRLGPHFPDGVMFVDLYGHSTHRPPESAGDVLDRLLRRLALAPESIPQHLDDRTALLSEVLVGRRMLLVLDNARDVTQVLPLLPATGSCGVLVTSRDRMTGLDEARHVPLSVLPRAESVELFSQVAGLDGSAENEPIVGELARHCGDLPLALRIAAARYRVEPVESLAGLLAQLADEHGRLAELDDGTRSVSAVFAVSQANLPDLVRRAFALLGMHPGPDLTAAHAAALLGQSLSSARRVLDVLVDRHLLERAKADRYRFHDLVGAFARQQAESLLPASYRSDAFRRLADDLLARAAAADEILTPYRHRIDLDLVCPPVNDRPPGSYAEALGWVSAEEPNLVAMCRAAGDRGFDVVCWQLAYTLRGYFFLTKSWNAWQSTHESALAAAGRLKDRWAEAMTLNNLGLAALEQDQLDVASDRYQAARILFAQIDDGPGIHNAGANLAWVAYAESRFDDFLTDLGLAAEFYRRHGMARNAAISLRGLALGEIALGRSAQAIRQLRESLVTFRELDLHLDVAIALNNLGEAHAANHEPGPARQSHLDAVEAARACGSTFEEARAWSHLADLAEDAGSHDSARAERHKALALYDELKAPQAARLQALLGGAAPADAPPPD